MPEFAHDFGHEKQDWAYSILLGANAGGAAIGGLLLEGTGLLRANARNAADLFDPLVSGDRRFRGVHELCAGGRVAILRGAAQFNVSFDGANSRATTGTDPTTRAL